MLMQKQPIIHHDPISFEDNRENSRNWVENKVQTIDGRLTINDLLINESIDAIEYTFDVYIPMEVNITDEKLEYQINNALINEHKNVKVKMTIDRSNL